MVITIIFNCVHTMATRFVDITEVSIVNDWEYFYYKTAFAYGGQYSYMEKSLIFSSTLTHSWLTGRPFVCLLPEWTDWIIRLRDVARRRSPAKVWSAASTASNPVHAKSCAEPSKTHERIFAIDVFTSVYPQLVLHSPFHSLLKLFEYKSIMMLVFDVPFNKGIYY